MRKRHTTYKLPDDSLESTILEAQKAHVVAYRAATAYASALKELEQAKADVEEFERKILYLMQAKNVRTVTVNRVKYTLKDGKLSKELLLRAEKKD